MQKVLSLANVKEACLFPRDRRGVRTQARHLPAFRKAERSLPS